MSQQPPPEVVTVEQHLQIVLATLADIQEQAKRIFVLDPEWDDPNLSLSMMTGTEWLEEVVGLTFVKDNKNE